MNHCPSGAPGDQVYPHLYKTSLWDERVFGFTGDLEVNNHINIKELSEDVFDLTPEVNVPTLGTIDAAVGTQMGQDALDPIPNNMLNMEKICSRFLVQVPPSYIPLVLNTTMLPIEAWMTLGAAIMGNGNEISFEHLLNWLRVLLMKQTNLLGGIDVTDRLATCEGLMNVVFPPLSIDLAVNEFCWNILKHNLPMLDQNSYATTDPVMHIIREMRDERKENWEQEKE